MNTKLKELTRAIQKANPELLELGFGCRVDIDGKKRICIGEYIAPSFINSDYVLKFADKFGDNLVFKTPYKEDIEELFDLEIIGKDITLEDVLYTLDKKGIDVRTDGMIIECLVTGKMIMWIPLAPLQDQSVETVELLWELLVKKNG